jgi:hypothetical protein
MSSVRLSVYVRSSVLLMAKAKRLYSKRRRMFAGVLNLRHDKWIDSDTTLDCS